MTTPLEIIDRSKMTRADELQAATDAAQWHELSLGEISDAEVIAFWRATGAPEQYSKITTIDEGFRPLT